MPVPVIDLFAGPGGLGEGFSSLHGHDRQPFFSEDLEATLHRYVDLYNHHIPQKARGHLIPIQAQQKWQASHSQLFHKKVYKQTGLDI